MMCEHVSRLSVQCRTDRHTTLTNNKVASDLCIGQFSVLLCHVVFAVYERFRETHCLLFRSEVRALQMRCYWLLKPRVHIVTARL